MSDEEKDVTGGAWRSLGDFIRGQRELANLSMRQLAEIAKISNPYLSQVERGLYKPSADVLKNIANALRSQPRRCIPRRACSTTRRSGMRVIMGSSTP